MKYNLSEVENTLLIVANDNEQVRKIIKELLLRNGIPFRTEGKMDDQRYVLRLQV
jgi:hypothetical protein